MIKTWATLLKTEKAQPYFLKALAFVKSERDSGKIIYPPEDKVFNAFKLTSFENLKVVILGQWIECKVHGMEIA
jgi:uracil-DNA glycosylase